jgi:gluconate 2-dehydrogenase alpha chain
MVLMNNGVGGSSIHWGSQSWRYLPWNFATRSQTIARYGASAIPPDSTVADWPLTYDDLEPYYDKVEYLHGESGQAGNIQGVIQPGGNPLEAPRSRAYPNPPLRAAGWPTLIANATTRMGYHPFPQPSLIRSQPYQGMPACTYCNLCSSNGCYIDAKGGTQLAGIPQAEATGHLTVMPGARVTQINVDANGRATGVTFLQGGQEYFQPATVVILSTYVYENVRLLLLSTSPAFPKGLSNNHGQVGKHFISHLYGGVNGLFSGKALNAFNGTTGQAIAVDDFNADNFDHTGLEFIGGGYAFFSTGHAAISSAQSAPPSLGGWGSEWKAWLKANTNSIGSTTLQMEALSYDDQFLDLDPVAKDPQGFPVVRVTARFHDQELARHRYIYAKAEAMLKEAGATETWAGGLSASPTEPRLAPVNSHAYGGTRMGTDLAQSVVDSYGVSHEVPNLMVLGGSAWPTSTGYNPTKTIMAWSWRAADHLVNNWSSIAG